MRSGHFNLQGAIAVLQTLHLGQEDSDSPTSANHVQALLCALRERLLSDWLDAAEAQTEDMSLMFGVALIEAAEAAAWAHAAASAPGQDALPEPVSVTIDLGLQMLVRAQAAHAASMQQGAA
jgi:hypothetical protein